MNRAVNGNIEQGMAIVTGIEQGIHAWAKESAEFELISLVDGETKVFREKMSVSRLRKVAAEGGFETSFFDNPEKGQMPSGTSLPS